MLFVSLSFTLKLEAGLQHSGVAHPGHAAWSYPRLPEQVVLGTGRNGDRLSVSDGRATPLQSW